MSDQQNNNDNQPTGSSPTQSRRRSSNNFMPDFSTLQDHKRGEASTARRQSMTDQHAKGGIFSQIFHNTVGRNSK